MAGIPTKTAEGLDYPTSDGKPLAETDWRRDLMNALIQTLAAYYAAEPMVYVSGNLLVFYKPGNRRRHLSPDVFVVKGVAKHQRPNYLIWEEGKGPEVVIELTSQSTREEDVEDKYELYQDTLCVPEYFLFDPLGDYLQPALQGHRLRRGRYEPILPVKGRLPSKVLGIWRGTAANCGCTTRQRNNGCRRPRKPWQMHRKPWRMQLRRSDKRRRKSSAYGANWQSCAINATASNCFVDI